MRRWSLALLQIQGGRHPALACLREAREHARDRGIVDQRHAINISPCPGPSLLTARRPGYRTRMADPTIKDVLDAITTLAQRLDRFESATADNFGAVRNDASALRHDLSALREDVAAHRRETAKGFADLDAELAKHADPIHRKLEERVAALEARTVRKTPRPAARRPRRG
jgi:hypothetical protein